MILSPLDTVEKDGREAVFFGGDVISEVVLQFREPTTGYNTTLPAMYSRSCGGRTRTLAELGLASCGYPYYAG